MDGFRSQLSLGLEPRLGGSKTSETLLSAGLGPIEFGREMAWMQNTLLADTFLSLLDGASDSFTYQSVGEGKQKGNHSLTRILHGSLQERMAELVALNNCGAGVFVTINETDGRGRKTENIIRVRSIWQDEDDGYSGSFPLPPSMVVSSSPGKFQRYWWANDLPREDFKALMDVMVDKYGSDKRALGINRVLRLPGFFHHKADPYLVTIPEASGVRYSADELLRAFPPREKPKPKSAPHRPIPFATSAPAPGERDTFRIKTALDVIDPDPYDTWIQIGQVLHSEYDGYEEGLFLWMNWAQASPKFDLKEHEYKWGTFGKTEGARLGLGTLFWLAEKALWPAPRNDTRH
jgi:hypothetical protein